MPRTSALKESVPPRSPHERHRPEKTLLYGIIDRYYPEFRDYMSEQGRSLPCHLQKEFDEYLSRPAVSEKRLSLTSGGNIRYQLKTPYSDGTTYVIFGPLDFISKLASLVPKPRVNLTRFHGVFVGVPHHPNSKHRSLVTPARCGKSLQEDNKTPEEKRRAMSWAQRLKRVFNIDIETCEYCGGHVKVIACIEDQL